MPAPAANAPLSGRYPAAGAIFRPFAALAAILALVLLAPLTASAQVGSGALQGKVTDVETGEPLPFVNVVLFLNGNQVTGGNTDCLLYTSPSPRDQRGSRMPSSA